jgi:hypothetical protein
MSRYGARHTDYFFTGSAGFDAAGATDLEVSTFGVSAGLAAALVTTGAVPAGFVASTGLTLVVGTEGAAVGVTAGLDAGATWGALAAAFDASTGLAAGAAAGVVVAAGFITSAGLAAPRFDLASCAIAGRANAIDTVAAVRSVLVLLIGLVVLFS